MNLIGELLGTFILVLLGNGVVASCILSKTKAENSGWLTIVLGWGIAVTIAAYVSGVFGPAHLNPAVTIAMASIGSLPWAEVPGFLLAQFAGAMLASIVLYLHFYPHWQERNNPCYLLYWTSSSSHSFKLARRSSWYSCLSHGNPCNWS